MDDSDSNCDTEESSGSYCSEVSEDEGMIINNSDYLRDDNDGNFSAAKMYSERPTVSMKYTSDTAECDTSPQKNIDSSLSDQSVLNLSHSSFQNHSSDRKHLNCINLDVTAMIAYVSATANGGANFSFQDKFLNEQAACERKNPVKKTLHGYFEGKNMKLFEGF